VAIRAVDKIPQLNISEVAEAKIKGMIGDNGTGKFTVTMQSNSVMVGNNVYIRLLIDNSKSKLPVDHTRLTLHREIRAFAKTPAGETKEFLDQQPVLKHHRNLKIAKLMPDLVAEDQTFLLILDGSKAEVENHRFFYTLDYLDSLTGVSQAQLKQQREILPSMDSEFIKVSYKLEVQVGYSSSFGSKYDVPSVFIPLNIGVNP
jgi:hypothetical protein